MNFFYAHFYAFRLRDFFPHLLLSVESIRTLPIQEILNPFDKEDAVHNKAGLSQLSLLFNTVVNSLGELYQLYPLFPDVVDPLALSFYSTIEGFLSFYCFPSVSSCQLSSSYLLGHPSTVSLVGPSTIDRRLWQCEWFSRLLQLYQIDVPKVGPFNDMLMEVRVTPQK